MRVADPGDLDGESAKLNPGAFMREVEPARIRECVAQLAPWQPFAVDTPAVVGQQVARWVLRHRREPVVGPGNEHSWSLEQRAQRVEHGRYAVNRPEVVAGVDDEIWFERGECADPRHLPLL